MNFSSGASINALIDAPSLKIDYLPEGSFSTACFVSIKIKSHAKQLGSVSFGKRNNGKRKRKKIKKDRGTKQEEEEEEEEKIRRREWEKRCVWRCVIWCQSRLKEHNLQHRTVSLFRGSNFQPDLMMINEISSYLFHRFKEIIRG